MPTDISAQTPNVDTHVWPHVCTHGYVYTHVHAHVYVNVHIHVNTQVDTCGYTCTCPYRGSSMGTERHAYTHVNFYSHVCIHAVHRYAHTPSA